VGRTVSDEVTMRVTGAEADATQGDPFLLHGRIISGGVVAALDSRCCDEDRLAPRAGTDKRTGTSSPIAEPLPLISGSSGVVEIDDVAYMRHAREDSAMINAQGLDNIPLTDARLTGRKRRRPLEMVADDEERTDALPLEGGVEVLGDGGSSPWDDPERAQVLVHSRVQQESNTTGALVGVAHIDQELPPEQHSTHGHLAVSFGIRAVRARAGIG
jgi:hypothetical protein